MEQAFLIDIQNNQNIIYKVCNLYRDRREDQEDLFQEIVYQLWKAYPGFKGEAKLSTWMYRIALNTAIAAYRKPKVDITYPEEIPDHVHYAAELNSSENEERLFRALRILTDAEKAVISLYLEDYSYQEIAGITGLTESNVGVRLNRIKSKLKERLN
ncbi:sigma-70 family RNA polymerase sigma factor [Lacibacter sp. H375]|uniref:RNA polymerase sigma factor n=1 Tax=Lacibacter sp. H375 TaxID=3133424 RepID=UPI0030C56B2C